mmetsp:Transcript_16506/g.28032  ORF Transcript_16506/g.28032 Transcript_16506/m.28032 type:complete len:322 (+) Transcript_16506:571-1536(+)
MGAALASGGKGLIDENQDNRSISEYYSELFAYAPAILNEANKNGNPYERFKLSIKFAFSILHSMALQDVIQKKPITPLLGETYEGLFLMPDGNVNIFMESVYSSKPHQIKDLLTGEVKATIRPDQETTYIHIEGPKQQYQIFGNLTYNQSFKGNNMMISLLGTLAVKFKDVEGNDQTIKIQLPDYVLANYIHVEGKPRVALISGTMVLEDEKNALKSVIFVRGLIKKKSLFQTSYEPNVMTPQEMKTKPPHERLIQGIIYKLSGKAGASKPHKGEAIEKPEQVRDVDFQYAEVSGAAIDRPVIQNVSYSNWAGVHFADPIP